jgi:hypothetical protein
MKFKLHKMDRIGYVLTKKGSSGWISVSGPKGLEASASQLAEFPGEMQAGGRHGATVRASARRIPIRNDSWCTRRVLFPDHDLRRENANASGIRKMTMEQCNMTFKSHNMNRIDYMLAKMGLCGWITAGGP